MFPGGFRVQDPRVSFTGLAVIVVATTLVLVAVVVILLFVFVFVTHKFRASNGGWCGREWH